jgi:hypothetical protein
MIEVTNQVSGITIELEVPPPLPLAGYLAKTAGKGATASAELGRTAPPTPPEEFDFEVWVEPGNYKIEAGSDPRVKPK